MLPRLSAEEELTASRVHSLGGGLLDTADARAMIAGLEERMRGGRRARPPRAQPGELAGMGIGMVAAKPASPVREEPVSDV